MSVTKIGNKWKADIRPDGIKGKRYIRLFVRKAEALQFEKKLLAGKIETAVDDSRTLNELIKLWYDSHGKNLNSGKGTLKRLYAYAQCVGNPIASQHKVSEFSLYRNKRLNAGITPVTLNRELSLLRALYSECRRLGFIEYENPFSMVRRLKEKTIELSYLDDDQIHSLLLECEKSKNPSLTIVVTLCLSTGARWSEAYGFRRSHLQNGIVSFTNTKNSRPRYIPVSKEMQATIETFFSKHDRIDYCYSAYREAVERAGIKLPKGQLSHVLRHTFATHYLINGGSLVALQRYLGHSSLNITMKYAHFARSEQGDVIERNPLTKYPKWKESGKDNKDSEEKQT
ncbi:MAG: phage integrase [Gammaproteobacteria bacterium]